MGLVPRAVILRSKETKPTFRSYGKVDARLRRRKLDAAYFSIAATAA